jgi:hypothetical protein
MSRVSSRLIMVAILATCGAGCSPQAQRYIRFPNFTNPGPAAVQRAEAIYHDPYPLNDIGPEVVGGRPLGFQQPLSEVERARLVPVQPVVIQPPPIPGTTVVAPPVVSSPYAVAPPQPGAPLVPAPGSVVTSASPVTGPPIVTSPFAAAPVAPAPVLPAPPIYAVPPAPVATPTYPVAAPATGLWPVQSRAPY